MSYNPDVHHRRSIRLREYNYSWPGAYFVTTILYGRQCLFGDIKKGVMYPNEAGRMVEQTWLNLPQRFPFCDIGEWVVMPNHFHGMLVLHASRNEQTYKTSECAEGTLPNSLGRVIQAFKSLTSTAYIRGVHEKNWSTFERKLWLRNYWDRIIRNDAEWQRANDYIFNNPANWHKDKQHPEENARLRTPLISE